MTVRAGAAVWLILLGGMACGRGTHNLDADVLMPTAGAPATNDLAGQGGDDTVAGSTCSGSGPSCLNDCRAFNTVTDAICVDAQWTCPAGTRAFDDCPANACVRRTQSCCAPNGHVSQPDCNDDGTIGECPQGFATATGACLPQGVPIEDCSELQTGEACTNPELVCYTGKCGRNCSCQANDAGNLSWNCYALPC